MKTSYLILTAALFINVVISNKIGLGWTWNGIPEDLNLFKQSNISWVYNWERWVPHGYINELEYVAMQRTAKDIQNLDKYMNSNNATILLSFNEPDIASQANITAEDAAKLWILHGNNLTRKVRVGSPAISNSKTGIPWLKAFLPLCAHCKIDFIACHWYGLNFNKFKSHIENIRGNFSSLNIWVTEFALQGNATQEDQIAFMKQAVVWLENTTYVERYSWMGASRGTAGRNMIDNNGNLTTLGKDYIHRNNK